MQDEIITLKYSRVENGAPVPVVREISIAEVLAALEQMCSQPNDFTMWADGERVMSFYASPMRVVAQGEAKSDGLLWYSHEMTTAHSLESFVQTMYITQLLPNPDGSGLKSHYPISIEAWL